MSSNTVVLFGAGATRACGGPLTNEILPKALSPTVRLTIERESYIYLVDLFLVEIFYLPPQSVDRKAEDYPALPLLLSLIDKAINSNQPMGPNWPVDKLRQVRRGLQYLIFALLEYMLRQFDHNYYADLFQALDPSGEKPPTVISLNYDIIVDNALMRHTKKFPDYGCDIATESGFVARIEKRSCGCDEMVSFFCNEKENRLPHPQLDRV